MCAGELFSPGSARYVHLSDTTWLSREQLAEFAPLGFQIPGLVPFARSERRDLWCWYTAWRGPTLCPIVFCPRDSEEANFFAPGFASAVYRLLLEEFSGTWLSDPEYYGDDTPGVFRRYVEDLSQFLPPNWIGELRRIVSLPLREDGEGTVGFISRAEADSIVRRHIGFPELDQTFKHYC